MKGKTIAERRFWVLHYLFINLRGARLGNASPYFLKMVGDIMEPYPLILMIDPHDPYLDVLENRLNEAWCREYGVMFLAE